MVNIKKCDNYIKLPLAQTSKSYLQWMVLEVSRNLPLVYIEIRVQTKMFLRRIKLANLLTMSVTAVFKELLCVFSMVTESIRFIHCVPL
jgi:hypothetical protein